MSKLRKMPEETMKPWKKDREKKRPEAIRHPIRTAAPRATTASLPVIVATVIPDPKSIATLLCAAL